LQFLDTFAYINALTKIRLFSNHKSKIEFSLLSKEIIIASRGSDLALWQARFVQKLLKDIGLNAGIKIIKTKGDQVQDLSFDKMEGKGFFTKEIEDALLNKEADIAVHSHKDLPTTSPWELVIAAVSERENPSDWLLINKSAVDSTRLLSLKRNAVVGTSSARRKSQLLSFRRDNVIKDMRGNVPTRVQKLKDGLYDAILLAAAGVERLKLDLSDFYIEKISPLEFIPAPAQGVLAIQIRKDNKELFEKLQAINSRMVAEAIAVERKILNMLDGGCQLPLGAYCIKKDGVFQVWVSRSEAWDSLPVRLFESSPTSEGLAQRIIHKLGHIRPATVFITRDLDPDNYFFRTLNEHKYSVKGKSLIKTEALPFKDVPVTDWIFFSSKNGVTYFLERDPVIHKNVKWAAIGKGTEAALRKYGKKVEFVGHEADTAESGKLFAGVAKGTSVLFPQAQESLRSVQKQLDSSVKAIDLVVYKTTPVVGIKIPQAEIVVFTSPSSVSAYFKNTDIKSGQKLIAMGKSTAKKLEEHGCKNYITPYLPDELGLTTAVFGIQ
jgi:hydroxymethylbilane synthase